MYTSNPNKHRNTEVQKYKSTNPFQNQSISAFLDDSATL